MKSGKALLAFAAVALIGLACCGPWDGYKTYPVDIYAAGHHFQIPRNYFEVHPRHHQAEPKKAIAAKLQVLLPEFEPISETNKSLFDATSRRRLYVIINKAPDTTTGHLSRLVDSLRVDPDTADEYTKLGMTDVVYAGTGGTESAGTDYFTTTDRRFYMRCVHIYSTWAQTPSCSSYITLLGNIDTYVRFPRDRFNDFPQIIHNLESFLITHEVQQEGTKP